MVNAEKKNLSPLLAGIYGTSSECSTWRHHQVNEGMSCLEGESVWALGALRSLWWKKKSVAGTWREMHLSSNEQKEEWVEDYVDRVTAVARKWVEDAETALKQQQEDMRNAEKAGLTTTKHETTFEEIWNPIEDDLSDLASTNAGVDGQDEVDVEENAEWGKLSEHDESGWVMGTISSMIQCRMDCFRQKQMKFNQLRWPGWGDAADCFHERDKRYQMTEPKVPAVCQLQMDDDAASSAATTFGEPMETPESVARKSQMLQVTSRPGSCHMRLGSRKPQTHKHIPSLSSEASPVLSMIMKSKPVEPVSIHLCV